MRISKMDKATETEGTSVFVAIVVIFITIFITAVIVGGLLAGLAPPTEESTYTGYVVDAEVDRGFIFRTTTIHMKTHPRSSVLERFCVLESNENSQLDQLRQSLYDQTRLRITYTRPAYVGIWDCNAHTTIIENIEIANKTSG